MWSSGDPVLLRYVHEGRVSRVLPVNVAGDEAESTRLFIASGTPIRARAGLDGGAVARTLPYADRFARPWQLGDDVWSGFHVLMLAPARAAHAFWAIWDEEWRFVQWYVNLQEPLRRSRFGFDTADNVLDIVVQPDLSSWRWKDEDELADAVRVGRFTRAETVALRREGEKAIATIEARGWPFDRDWSSWRPDPRWAPPSPDPAAEVL